MDGVKHDLQVGDTISLREIQGMELSVTSSLDQIDSKQAGEATSINGSVHVVRKVVTYSSFELDIDLSKYTKYTGSGLVSLIKKPVTV